MFSPAFWWTLAGVALMICEFMVPGLILFFFGLGALVTALVTLLFLPSLTVQLVIFIVASLIALFGLRRFLKPIFMGRTTAVDREETVSEGLAGACGEVSEAIEPGKAGKILLNGVAWKAEAEQALAVGTQVVVKGQKSLTLIVEQK